MKKCHPISLLAFLALGASCSAQKVADERPIVAVTVLPQAYFVERLAGDAVQVEVIIPPGAGHSTYEPTARQLTALAKAQLYIKVGHPHFTFETAWLDKVLPGNSHLRVVDGSKGMDRDDHDPHIWMSLEGGRFMARNTAAGLSALLPDKASVIAQNLSELEKDIDVLDAEIAHVFSGLERKRFYVFHPAFGHFARELGLEQVAIEQGHREPSPEELGAVLALIKSDGAKVVIVQPQYSKQAAEVVAAETGARLVELDPLSSDWLSSMRQAARVIAEALAP
jgi:zinc transport system substrate-binding protein